MIAHLLTSAKACILSQWVPKGIVLWIVNAASQWQATLQCNVVSHWLSTFTIWSLFLIWSIFHLYHHCTVMESPFYPRGPIYKHGLTSIPAWICNSIHYKEWDEITYPFLYFNIFTVEVCEWMLNFIPHFKGRFRGGRTGYMPPLSKIISNTIIFITILYRDRYTILQWKIIFQIYHNWDIYKLKYMYTINIIIIFFEIYKNNSTTPDHHPLHHPHPTPTPTPPHPPTPNFKSWTRPLLHWALDYLSILRLKFIRVGIMGPIYWRISNGYWLNIDQTLLCQLMCYCVIDVDPRACWRHQMETFSALLAICAGNSPELWCFLWSAPEQTFE